MSSWANRHIYSRRDISKIPEALRPVIVGRADRPEVIMSETFQKQYETEKDFNSTKTMNEILYPKEAYPVKKLDVFVSHNTIELSHNNNSYVFVILRNIQNARDNDWWITSYNSIRKFYKNKIIIIDDNSKINTVNGKLINTDIIYSEWNGAGEVLPYYYFLQHKWGDRMIFLHDTMFLHRRFTDSELDNDIIFHWHFSVKDERNETSLRKLSTILSLFPPNLMEYASNPDNTWYGCFGGCSIITYDIVKDLEDKYNLFTKLAMNIRTRKDRQNFERIFGLILYYENLFTSDCSNFGDIMKYPDCFNDLNNTSDIAQSNVNKANYNTTIVKIWRGR
jgi:hypothetical protein